jgi:hypothetical protein
MMALTKASASALTFLILCSSRRSQLALIANRDSRSGNKQEIRYSYNFTNLYSKRETKPLKNIEPSFSTAAFIENSGNQRKTEIDQKGANENFDKR